MASLVATPLGPNEAFNWVYLVELLLSGILALFFLFYFNRLFATVISYIIRAWTWHQYRAYIDISALQISLLGGRIFFKRVRYHAHNITFLVNDGYITWRYWLGAVQNAEIFEEQAREDKAGSERTSGSRSRSRNDSSSRSEADQKPKQRSSSVGKAEKAGGKNKELPCRISVKIAGVEAFIYNRSPSYDMVVDAVLKKANSSSSSHAKSANIFDGQDPPSTASQDENEKVLRTETRDTSKHSNFEKPETPAWLRLLPVKIDCKRAAAAVGNEQTTSVVTAKLERAVGTIDAGHSGPLDLYKLLFNFEFEKCVAALKPNRDFKQNQLDAAQHILREKEGRAPKRHRLRDRPFSGILQAWQMIRNLLNRKEQSDGSIKTTSMKSVAEEIEPPAPHRLPGEAQWHGLSRYLDDNEADEHSEWQDIEYAKSSTLIDCSKLGFRFFYDMPGKVQSPMADTDNLLESTYQEDINGSAPPDYGMEFFVHSSVVVFGPWADRERIKLQHMFFPPWYVDSIPAQPLKPGDVRVWTVFKVYVSVEEDAVVRIPTRESSKDDQWRGRANKSHTDKGESSNERKHNTKRKNHRRQQKSKQGPSAGDVRPFGWLDITVKKDSTVHYVMDMVPRQEGYRNSLDVDAKGVEMTSSVNHGLLWRSGAVTLNADLGYPTGWNTLRKWHFNVVCDDLELFILRDHFFLIIDIVNDWSSGPPPEFYTFVPFSYDLNMEFRNWCMFLNVNDVNLINDPADMAKNDFLTLEGSSLQATLGIPMELYRPKRNEITWDVLSVDMRMRMLNPSRSTLSSLVKDKLVATLPRLKLSGGIDQNADSRPGLTDVLRFDIWATGLNLRAYGQLVRQFISLKENYFGDYIHFKTLEEFQNASENLEEANAKTASLPRPTTPNEMDVILCIVVNDSTIMLPTNLYSCSEYVRADLPVANLDLRITSYYLDMELNLSPLTFLTGILMKGEEDLLTETASNTQIYVSHVDLYGHRTFGLPPNEPAYLSMWDIDVGRLTGECSSAFIHNLALAGNAFIFGFEDGENALPFTSPNIFHDITFVQVRTDIVKLWLHVGNDALLFTTQPISVNTDDWAGDRFSQRINVLAPLVTVACVDGRSASRHRGAEGRKKRVRTYAFLQTGAVVDVMIRKLHFDEEKRAQQAHIRECDQRTRRTPFLQRRETTLPDGHEDTTSVNPPAMQVPPIPFPLNRSGRPTERSPSVKSLPSIVSGRGVRPKKSSSSISTSIKGPGSPPQGRMFKSVRHGASDGSSFSSQEVDNRSGDRLEALASGSSILLDDQERAKFGFPPSTMAFSSSFAEPYFPLDLVEPDEIDVPSFPSVTDQDDRSSDTSSTSETIGDLDADQDAEHTYVFIKLQPGVRGYVEPKVGAVAAKLINKLLPKGPEDVMDAFQMGVMRTVTGYQKERHGNASTLGIMANLPSAAVRVMNPVHKTSDQLDIVLRGLEQMVRLRKQPSAEGAKQSVTLHSAVDSVEGTMSEHRYASNLAQAVKFRVEGIRVWVSLGQTKVVHASVRDSDLTVSGSMARYLARLALRVLQLVDDAKSRFEAPMERYRKRLLLLIFTLTQHSEGIADPPFLTRMTYILRAFPDHFRNQESWKVVARFRHMLDCLSEDIRQGLITRYEADDLECPADAPTKVLKSWGQWRNWDVPNVNDTLAFQMLYSQVEARPLEEPEAQPSSVIVSSEKLRIAIGNGSDVNEIIIEDTSLVLDSTPPTKPTGLMVFEENKRTKTLLNLYTSSIDISFNWSAVGIAESLLPLMDDFRRFITSQQNKARPETPHVGDELKRHEFHIVLSTDNGSIRLQTINLRHLSRADGLKMSLIGTTQANERYGECVCALVNANQAAIELHDPSSCILQMLVISPSLYIDHLQPITMGSARPCVTIATAYNDLQIAVTEQLPGIIHMVDSIITDEVSKIMELVKAADSTKSEAEPQQDVSAETSIELNVAMVAGPVHVEILLLQALSYCIDGTTASIRVTPRLSSSKAANIDFDIGRQTHGFINLSKNERHHQGMLELPPINGSVGFEVTSEETLVSIAATVERVEIDATAIPGVISIVNKPEVQEVFTVVQAGIDDIKHHVAAIDFGPAGSEKPATGSASKTWFDVRFALLGIRVSASTPQVHGRSTAEVEFGVGPLHAKASNRGCISDENQLIPEIQAQIQDIGARLWIDDRGKHYPCGNMVLGIRLHFNSFLDKSSAVARELNILSDGLEINCYPETASTVIDVINHLQDRLRDLDLSKEVEYLRRVRDSRRDTVIRSLKMKHETAEDEEGVAFSAADLLAVKTTVTMTNILACWHVHRQFAAVSDDKPEDVVLTLSSIELTTHGGREARLTIKDVLLQLTQKNLSLKQRSLNSALLSEVGFSVAYWSQGKDRSFAFKASGKPLDVRLESRFIVPIKSLQNSIDFATERSKTGTAAWRSTPTATGAPRQKIFDTKRFASLLVEADFAGAQVYLQSSETKKTTLGTSTSPRRKAHHGRYGQFAAEGELIQTTLRFPGVAVKVEYNSHGKQPSVNGELRIDASTNLLLPNVVPLILEISNSVKEVMQTSDSPSKPNPKPKAEADVKASQRFFEDESIVAANPTRLFGKTKVDLGLRICRQEFGFSCQPIARVDATATLGDFYFTMNTIDSDNYGHFFAMSAVMSKLSAQIKHVYSREPTFSFHMESIVLSLMNSKHLSGINGISAIVKVNPTKLLVNGKQLQDLLLFHEIWLPPEIRSAAPAPADAPVTRQDDYIVQKYQMAAAAAAFPWNASVSITKLAVDLDLGQSIGKTSITITNLWASQQKSSNWEQNLCVGLEEMAMKSVGRMSGFINLAGLGVRTSIKWPQDIKTEGKIPLIQASVGFGKLRAKAAFDYQAFAFGDLEGFDFLMYNVRETHPDANEYDRLVAVLDCAKAYVFCTASSAAQAVGLYQAFDRLVQDKQAAYRQSLKGIEKHLRRESTVVPTTFGPRVSNAPVPTQLRKETAISLHTDVVVTLGAISLGVYPNTFFDSQILKLEANTIQAHFAVGLERHRIHSGLGMTMGELQVAVAAVRRMTAVPKALEVSVDEVIHSATQARGGTIVRVPKVVASMQTWQAPDSNSVDYVFKSLFDGKIDIGWNLSRINFIRGMWTTHSRSLASRLGKPVPKIAVKITAGSDEAVAPDHDNHDAKDSHEKITAEVSLPQSRYEYHALEPPIIETPQLRDMGEATPPLEWIGLQRDRLPNVTHQIIIVSLLEVAKEVEDAYGRILGSS